ncbi:MAG: hypothetical protein V3V20_08310 [Algisphaera sp.]
MATTASPPTSPTSYNAHCVLLVGSHGAVPSNLVAALNRRGIGATIARQAPEVMAELAAGKAASVVVVEPELQTHISELHAAACVYHPDVRFWIYTPQQPGHEARLTNFHPRPSPANASEAQNTASASPTSQEPHRQPHQEAPHSVRPKQASGYHSADDSLSNDLTTAHASVQTNPRESRQHFRSLVTHAQPVDDEQASPLVTEQELAMLLGSDSPPPNETTPRQKNGPE